MLHIHVPLFHLLSCNLLLHPQVKLERSRIAPIILWSIPAGRGKVALCIVDVHAIGITPARAGKRYPSSSPAVRPEDHPRACGEKNKELEGVWLPMGSPPRGRGKAELSAAIDHVLGITPA